MLPAIRYKCGKCSYVVILERIVFRMWGINWDLGAYGGINITRRVRTTDKTVWKDMDLQPVEPQPYSENVVTYYRRCKAMNLFEYGATTRISYTFENAINLGVFARYRLSDVITKPDGMIGNPANQPSPWSFGIEFEIMP